MQQGVGPGGEHAARLEDAADLGVKGVAAEPVQGLRHGDQVAAMPGQAAGFGRCGTVVNARIDLGLGNLFGRQVGGMDATEVFRQRTRRLAIAGAAVPGQVVARRIARQPGEEFGRVGRPRLGVIRGVAGKVVGGQGVRPAR
jgi:hypothetical protein